jgi:osmoprotectant transport system ATP-binding protein
VERAGARAALELRDAEKRYGPMQALARVSFSVEEGQRAALIGESGSGKTTLLRTFNRTVELDAGSASVEGRDVRTVDPVALRRSIGFVQQEGGLLPHWTVERNVTLVPRLRGLSDAAERGRDALSLVGLDPGVFARRWPSQLSGGQRQRVALARALAARPKVLLLDEPFAALDAITRSELQESFAEVVERLRITVLLVTHDLREAELLAERVAVMREGTIEQVASPEELRSHPATPYVRRLHERAGLA